MEYCTIKLGSNTKIPAIGGYTDVGYNTDRVVRTKNLYNYEKKFNDFLTYSLDFMWK